MDGSDAVQRVGMAISYPTLEEWALAYELDVTDALQALRECHYHAYGPRVGMLDRVRRRESLDLYRFIAVVDQLDLISAKDVLAFGHWCPAQIGRYCDALVQLIARAVQQGAPMGSVHTAERVHRLLSRIHEEVTTFYQGLS